MEGESTLVSLLLSTNEVDVMSFTELHSAQPVTEPILHEGTSGERGTWVWEGRLLVYAPGL